MYNNSSTGYSSTEIHSRTEMREEGSKNIPGIIYTTEECTASVNVQHYFSAFFLKDRDEERFATVL